jgi:hypothetical protein
MPPTALGLPSPSVTKSNDIREFIYGIAIRVPPLRETYSTLTRISNRPGCFLAPFGEIPRSACSQRRRTQSLCGFDLRYTKFWAKRFTDELRMLRLWMQSACSEKRKERTNSVGNSRTFIANDSSAKRNKQLIHDLIKTLEEEETETGPMVHGLYGG